MISPACQHSTAKKHGRDKFRRQRYRCLACGATFTRDAKPLGDSRLPVDRAVLCLRLLLEGNSIRTTSRLTETSKNAIIDLMVTVGQRCKRFLKSRIKDIEVDEVQCDELWGFIGCKEKTRERKGYGPEMGDCYAYVALERNTKLVVTYHAAKRSSEGAWEFIDNLYFATSGRFQISTDGFTPYQSAIPLIFQFGVDFAQVIKRFGGVDSEDRRRYSPAPMIKTLITRGCGDPDLERASTSHIERLNLSIRMGNRRLTRLTNAHSKKWENHDAMLGLWFAYYNFCRKHETIKTTPAVAQGLTDHVWTVEELLEAVAAY